MANSLNISSESSSDLVEGAYGNTNSRLIYGVFSTPNNAIAGSAICAFSLQVNITAFQQHPRHVLSFVGAREFRETQITNVMMSEARSEVMSRPRTVEEDSTAPPVKYDAINSNRNPGNAFNLFLRKCF